VPTLTVGGYYDQEDMYGPQIEYSTLEPHDDKHENFLVLGPWRHGYWSSSSRRLGNVDYGEPIGKEYRERIEAKFFGHYLKDDPGFDLEDTASFQTGSNTWKRYSHFPPKQAEATGLHLGGDGKLSWTEAKTQAKTTYISDPANPVPYRHRPIEPTYGDGSQWYDWLTEDQRFATDRRDVAVWKLPVLKKDLIVTGEVMADIFASTTGTDGDFVVKLIDVYPDEVGREPRMGGYELMIAADILRGRYRDSFSEPKAIPPDQKQVYRFALPTANHVFLPGHRIMVQVQSSWFPVYDRNPQTYVENIFFAKPADYKKATVKIFDGGPSASFVELPVVHQR